MPIEVRYYLCALMGDVLNDTACSSAKLEQPEIVSSGILVFLNENVN